MRRERKPKPRAADKPRTYDLQAGLRYWQKQLRLQDWDVRAAWVPHYDDRGGNVIIGRLKTSTISINDLLREELREAETTLVHELLHIPFDFLSLKDDSLEDMLMEQAVETLAKALVSLRREAKNR
jgi:hypothetical protein